MLSVHRLILEREGPRSLFRGLGPNLVGVAPSRYFFFPLSLKLKFQRLIRGLPFLAPNLTCNDQITERRDTWMLLKNAVLFFFFILMGSIWERRWCCYCHLHGCYASAHISITLLKATSQPKHLAVCSCQSLTLWPLLSHVIMVGLLSWAACVCAGAAARMWLSSLTSLLQHHMSTIVLPLLISFISCPCIAAVLSILVKGLHIQYRVQSCS